MRARPTTISSRPAVVDAVSQEGKVQDRLRPDKLEKQRKPGRFTTGVADECPAHDGQIVTIVSLQVQHVHEHIVPLLFVQVQVLDAPVG